MIDMLDILLVSALILCVGIFICTVVLKLEEKHPKLRRYLLPLLIFTPLILLLLYAFLASWGPYPPDWPGFQRDGGDAMYRFDLQNTLVVLMVSMNNYYAPYVLLVGWSYVLRFFVKIRQFGFRSGIKYSIAPICIVVSTIFFWGAINLLTSPTTCCPTSEGPSITIPRQ